MPAGPIPARRAGFRGGVTASPGARLYQALGEVARWALILHGAGPARLRAVGAIMCR